MTFPVLWGGRTVTADARWRLALAATPTDAVTGLPVTGALEVGVEPGPGRRPGAVRGFAPPERFDRPMLRNRGGTYTLVERPPGPDRGPEPVREVVLRLADPGRLCVPRRLRVPVWTLRGDADPSASASARSVSPVLFPGSAYLPPGGCTGIRGQLLRYGEPLRFARVAAVGRGGAVLGRTQGDERGEFLLLLARTGSEPMPPPSVLSVRLEIAAAPFGPAPTGADPLGGLAVEDAVLRGPGAAPGEVDAAVLRGVRDPVSYVLASQCPVVELRVGTITAPPPLSVT